MSATPSIPDATRNPVLEPTSLTGRLPKRAALLMCRLARGDSHLRAAVTVVAVVTAAAAIARPVLHAAEIALHIALVTAAAAAGVAAMAAVVFIVIRVHRRQARALTALPSSRARAAGQPVAAVPAPRLLPIEAPGLSAAGALGLEELDGRRFPANDARATPRRTS